MKLFSLAIFFGWFIGFFFGVGCALAVMYSIYRGGYRDALFDGKRGTNPKRYKEATLWVDKKIEGKVTDSLL